MHLMLIRFFRLSPTALMSLFVATAFVGCALASLLALRLPQLDLPNDAVLQKVGSTQIIATDLYPEPDHLGTYPRMLRFFERQTQITAEMNQPMVSVTYSSAGVSVSEFVRSRDRKVSDLSFAFWFQQAVGILALLTAGWVLSLRRMDWGAGMFALTGFSLATAAMSAGVYSTRQIALDGDLFRVLSAVNHSGSIVFGMALVGLFLMYPRPMIRPHWLFVPFGLFSVGLALEILFVGKNLWVTSIIGLQLLLAIAFGVVQWWRVRGDQVDRAGLRWFFLFSIIGCSLFIGLSVAPPALGLSDQGYVPQAYAFGFFNLMHIGLAFAVTRWRVFELDRYANYIWLWIGGAFLIFATDLVLLIWLREQPWASLSLALVFGGFVYFPMRQLLLSRLFRRRTPDVSELMPYVLDAALAPSAQLQAARWDQLLQDTFNPAAELETPEIAPLKPQIRDDGVGLAVPGPNGMSPRILRYASKGRRLFSSEDVKLAETLLNLHKVISQSHLAYERGVSVERDRISRDVHDNIGAQLLTALHATGGSRKDALLRDTLTDLRQIISDGFRSDFRLLDILADVRAEMGDRLAAHDIAFMWNDEEIADQIDQPVPFLMINTLRSVVREATSNIIKHAKADVVRVNLTQLGDTLDLKIVDNGVGFDTGVVARGEGLNNMIERVTSQGGRITFHHENEEMCVHLCLPLVSPISDFAQKAAQ
jgi:signal transduction histidine kinase